MDATETPVISAEEELQREIEELRARNRELVETIDAIRRGEVDAIVVSEGDRQQVYSLEGADQPYRVLVENIQEGALTLTTTGMILYANAAFATMLRQPLSALPGSALRDHFAPRDRAQFDALLVASRTGACRGELSFCSGPVSFPVQVSMTPIAVNNETKISVVVTDRRQDYRRLRLQARMLDSVVDAVTAVDPDGTIIYWNESAEQLYGWPASEMIGRTLFDTVYSGMQEDARRIFEEPTAGETGSGEYVARHRDGHCFPVLATRAPVYDEDGALVAVIGTSHDISERKRAELDLRESEERYRTLFESMDEGFCIIEVIFGAGGKPVDYRFLEANRAFEKQTGLHDAVGKRIREFVPNLEEDWFDIYGAIARTGEPRRFINPAKPLMGGWFDVYASRMGERGSNRVAVLFNDITERMRAEEALRESEERYRTLFESMNDPCIIAEPVLDADGTPVDYRFVDSNPANEEYTGSPRASAIGRTASELVPTVDPFWAGLIAAVARDGEPRSGENRGSADERWFSYSAYTPAPGRCAVQYRDISAFKEVELSLGRYAEDLKRSNEELQRFAYVASHDLQEPLRSIVSFSQLLERRYRGKLDQDADEFIGFIVEGGNRMQALIRDLLQVSRIETGAKPLEPTDTAEIVGDVLRSFDATLREAGATVEVGDLPVVMADRAQLEQVFSNLVGNAVKYHRPGVPPEGRVSGTRRGDRWEFSVADNGIGIEEEYFGRIFEMFRRLHTHEEYTGTGIGLAVVRKIVERHGGRIGVESTPGEGSTFFFTLPAA